MFLLEKNEKNGNEKENGQGKGQDHEAKAAAEGNVKSK